jgi:acetyl-CoA acetyltransferase
MRDVYVVGIATTRFGKFPAVSVKDLTRQAVSAALGDAGCALGDVEAAWFSNVRQGQMEGQNSIRGQCALRAMGVAGIPIVNVENACASSSTGVNQAYAALAAGLCDVALVVGAEKMFFPDKKAEMFAAFLGGTDVHMVEDTHRRLADLGRGAVPAGVNDPDPAERSFFMDIYAGLARQHMQRFGTTVRQLAAAAAKNHANSAHNPNAQYTQAMTVDQVLGDRPVTWPLTRAMCAPLSDGAAAAVLCAGPALPRFARGRAARILASVVVSGTDRAPDDYARHCGRLAASRAYAQAGLGPEDMDVAEVHDATSFAEILQIENLGFCAPGEGGPATERGDTALGGRIPVNTSGGLVSKGHPIAATGIAMMHEIVTQLRGEAGARQVADARVGIVENGGGFWGVEEAATAITILGRA